MRVLRHCRIFRLRRPSDLVKRSSGIAALFAVFLLAAAPQALADLKLCNSTDSHVGIAVGYKGQSGWTTEGWWNLAPNACEILLSGSLIARYYYVYAVDYDLGGEWAGKAFMCTQDRMFTISGFGDCEKRGFALTGFIEIDTGDERSWTVQLTEPAQQGTGGR